MKKTFLTIPGVAILLFVSACSMGNDDPGTVDNTMPTLTIRNESSVKLYDAKWGNNILGDFEPGDTRSTEVDAGSGYVFFFKGTKQTSNGIVVYDGLNCRSNEVVSVETGAIQFTFTDNTLVVETGNEANQNSLSRINFLSQIAIESSDGLRY
jgi:hypothetical protein